MSIIARVIEINNEVKESLNEALKNDTDEGDLAYSYYHAQLSILARVLLEIENSYDEDTNLSS